MKKSKNQKKLLLKNKKIPCFWIIVNEFENRMTVMNWVTGTFAVLDK